MAVPIHGALRPHVEAQPGVEHAPGERSIDFELVTRAGKEPESYEASAVSLVREGSPDRASPEAQVAAFEQAVLIPQRDHEGEWKRPVEGMGGAAVQELRFHFEDQAFETKRDREATAGLEPRPHTDSNDRTKSQAEAVAALVTSVARTAARI